MDTQIKFLAKRLDRSAKDVKAALKEWNLLVSQFSSEKAKKLAIKNKLSVDDFSKTDRSGKKIGKVRLITLGDVKKLLEEFEDDFVEEIEDESENDSESMTVDSDSDEDDSDYEYYWA